MPLTGSELVAKRELAWNWFLPAENMNEKIEVSNRLSLSKEPKEWKEEATNKG